MLDPIEMCLVHDIELVDAKFGHTTSGWPASIYDPHLTVGSAR